MVEERVADSPAEKAELRASSKAFDLNGEQVMIGGDVITAVDGKTVKTMQDLSAAIKAQKPGDKVELTVLRNGEEVAVAVTLGERKGAQAAPTMPMAPAEKAPKQPKAAASGAWLGISGLTLAPEIADAMNLDSDQTGALVGEVVTNGPADDAGLKASAKPFEANGEQIMIGGDVITAVDGKTVKTMQDLSAAIKVQKPGAEVELTVLRDGKEITVTVTLGERKGTQAMPMAPVSPDRTRGTERESTQAARSGDFRRLAGDQRLDAHVRCGGCDEPELRSKRRTGGRSRDPAARRTRLDCRPATRPSTRTASRS